MEDFRISHEERRRECGWMDIVWGELYEYVISIFYLRWRGIRERYWEVSLFHHRTKKDAETDGWWYGSFRRWWWSSSLLARVVPMVTFNQFPMEIDAGSHMNKARRLLPRKWILGHHSAQDTHCEFPGTHKWFSIRHSRRKAHISMGFPNACSCVYRVESLISSYPFVLWLDVRTWCAAGWHKSALSCEAPYHTSSSFSPRIEIRTI